jgi:hypothetical protein
MKNTTDIARVGSGVWLGGSSLDVKSPISEPTQAATCRRCLYELVRRFLNYENTPNA